MRYRVAAIPFRTRYLVGGLLQLAGVALIIRYAGQPDDYYQDGTTHWDHATNGGGASWAVVAAALAATVAAAFLAQGLFTRLKIRRVAILSVVVYVISLFAAFFFLTVGH